LQPSRYDDLHDRYHAILTTKSGTRYERLAAMVFKILECRSVIIHDLKLVGDSSVSHQIDVSIETDGNRRRIIIECKDFDLSGNKVGLDILRSFRSVVEDTGADEGIVLTCTGYTEDAQRYAKAKGIKLAVLREIQSGDMDGLIQAIVINLHVQSHRDHRTTVNMSQSSHDQFTAATQRLGITNGIHNYHPVFFVRGSERIGFTDFLSAEVNNGNAVKTDTGRWEVRTQPNCWALQIENDPPIPFDMIVTSYDIDTEVIPITVTSDRIAELLLAGFGDDDIIIFGDQIERRQIDPETGEIL
jgi:hypothetical protein